MAPQAIEEDLLSGAWLILIFAVWSKYDIEAIEIAIRGVKKYKGKLNLGIRPFHDVEEMTGWLPLTLNKESDLNEKVTFTEGEDLPFPKYAGRTPYWLTMEGRKLKSLLPGVLSEEDLENHLSRSFK